MDYVAHLGNGQTFTVRLADSPLGRGGEGSVYAVESTSSNSLGSAAELVGKIYHDDPTKQAEREAKCVAMLQSVPKTDSIVWNLGNLYTAEGKFAGFLMKRFQPDVYKTFMEVAHTRHRRKKFPKWSVMHSLLMARNLAVAIDAVHTAGHKVGDINESNVLVASDATVKIIDADSVQIGTPNGDTYPCTVGKPDFTAPEISEGSYRDPKNKRTSETDMFAFVIMLFGALMGRAHPTSCKYNGPQKDTTDLIKLGVYPTFVNPLPPGYQKIDTLEYEAIPTRIHNLIRDGLNPDPTKRPTFNQAITTFDELFTTENGTYSHLKQCKTSPLHWWDKRDSKACPLCKFAAKNRNFDIWRKPETKTQKETLLNNAQKKQTKTQKTKQNTPTTTHTLQTPPTPKRGTQAPHQNTPTPQNLNTPTHRQPGQPPTPQMVGKKLAVHDTNGNTIPRPPITDLIKSGNYTIALDALSAEHPKTLPWLSNYKPTPTWWISLLTTTITALLWWLTAPHITQWALPLIFPQGTPPQILPLTQHITTALWAIPTTVATTRFIHGLWIWGTRTREIKKYGYGTIEYEHPKDTIIGTITASIISGFLAPLLALFIALANLAVWLIHAAFNAVLGDNETPQK